MVSGAALSSFISSSFLTLPRAKSIDRSWLTYFLQNKALDFIRLNQLHKRPRLKMEDPNSISIGYVFVFHFFSSLIQTYRDLLFLFFWGRPSIKNRILLEIQIKIFNFQSLINLDIKKSCRIERNIDIDILLIIKARFQVKNAKLSRYFQ